MPRKPKPPSDEVLAALVAKPLSPFEGREVVRASVEYPSAGGGLHAPLAFEPVELVHDQEGYTLLHWRCRKVRFDEIKDSNALERVHVCDVSEATFFPDSEAEAYFAEQRDRIQQLREEAQGITRLPGMTDGEGFYDPGATGYPPDGQDEDDDDGEGDAE